MAAVTDRDNVEAALALGQRSTSYSVKKNMSWGMTLFLAYESTGVVFGDIGTSPLYVFSTTFAGNGNGLNSNEDLIGALSLILWSLTLSPLLKYCFIVLLCDDNGEGGTFAAYGLLCRYLRIGRAGGRTADEHNISQYTLDAGERGKFAEKVKTVMEATTWLKTTILTIVLFATCMVIGDGVLTPAQSVLSAIGGIAYPDPGITQGVVVGVSCAILALLFLGQRFGTAKIGFTFAPIVIVFLLMIAIVGIWNLARYNAWWVFKAVSPHYGILFLTRNGKLGWIRLGGIFLTITGTEATYADLGHFSARATQISFGCFVYPCLCLAYIGQAAWLSQPENAANVSGTFYLSIPQSKGIYWIIFIFATAAAAVASQAMISATFSIVRQSMALGCFPRVKVIHTSNYVKGQIYIPEVNYILAVLTLLVTGIMGQHGTTEIGNAYGIAVNAVMIITTCLVTLILIEVKRKPFYIWLPFFCFFFFAEAVYLSSNLYKVPHGGWVPLAFAAVFMCVMSVWRYGTNKKHQHNLEHKLSLDWVTNLLSSERVARVPGLGLFYTELTSGVPAIFSHFIASVPAVHEVIVFVSVKHIEVPNVLSEERCIFARVGAHRARMYRCVVRYGYNDISRENVRSLTDQLVESLALYIRMEDPQNWRIGGATLTETAPMLASDGQPLTFENEESKAVKEEEVQRLTAAKDSAVIHIIGRSYMKAKEGISLRSIFDKVVINYGYHFLNANTRDAVSTLGIPTENLLEVGMVVYT